MPSSRAVSCRAPPPEGEYLEIQVVDPPFEIPEDLRAEFEAWDHASVSASGLVDRLARDNAEDGPLLLTVEIQEGGLSRPSQGRNHSRLQWRLRTLLLAVPACGVGLAVLTVILSGCDAMTHGP